jgi:hypothetical protein
MKNAMNLRFADRPPYETYYRLMNDAIRELGGEDRPFDWELIEQDSDGPLRKWNLPKNEHSQADLDHVVTRVMYDGLGPKEIYDGVENTADVQVTEPRIVVVVKPKKVKEKPQPESVRSEKAKADVEPGCKACAVA